jgi:hypothetical protein
VTAEEVISVALLRELEQPPAFFAHRDDGRGSDEGTADRYTLWKYSHKQRRWKQLGQFDNLVKALCVRQSSGGCVLRQGEPPPDWIPDTPDTYRRY